MSPQAPVGGLPEQPQLRAVFRAVGCLGLEEGVELLGLRPLSRGSPKCPKFKLNLNPT